MIVIETKFKPGDKVRLKEGGTINKEWEVLNYWGRTYPDGKMEIVCSLIGINQGTIIEPESNLVLVNNINRSKNDSKIQVRINREGTLEIASDLPIEYANYRAYERVAYCGIEFVSLTEDTPGDRPILSDRHIKTPNERKVFDAALKGTSFDTKHSVFFR